MQGLRYCFLTKLPKIKDVKVTINKLILGQFSFFSKQFWYNLKILIVYENSVCLLL